MTHFPSLFFSHSGAAHAAASGPLCYHAAIKNLNCRDPSVSVMLHRHPLALDRLVGDRDALSVVQPRVTHLDTTTRRIDCDDSTCCLSHCLVLYFQIESRADSIISAGDG